MDRSNLQSRLRIRKQRRCDSAHPASRAGLYPHKQFRDGKTGAATVAVLVNSQGDIKEMSVVEETAPEFGQALLAACQYFGFAPGMFQGSPTDAVVTVEVKFNSDSLFIADKRRAKVATVKSRPNAPDKTNPPAGDDYDMLRLEKKSPEKIISAKKLDAMPKLIVKREPPFPIAALQANIAEGETVIECLVDTEGKVRLPRIVSGTHPSFGYMAVQTVANWRFAPPKAQGEPVVTRIRIPFGFSFSTRNTAPSGGQ